jgi:hypothetical protein
MSIAGYFGKEVRQLRMPEKADATGIEFEGDVLRGETSVEQARALNEVGRDGFKAQLPVYLEVDDYDPVLHWHCRL